MTYSRPTEADHLLVLSTAKTLGVELEEWQRFLLLGLFSAHRQRPADPEPGALCGDESPALLFMGGTRLRCELYGGDHRQHQAGDIKWVHGTCGKRHPETLRECVRPAGHVNDSPLPHYPTDGRWFS